MAKLKRPRTVQGQNTATFTTSDQLIEALRSQSPEALKNALVSFRNQITVGYDERPGVGDARVILVTSWLEKSSGASELFDIWDTGSNYTSLVLASLAHTLSLISGTPTGSTHAAAILRVLFDSTHARRLNAHLASGQTDVVLAALKVLGAAALIDQRSTFDAVSWTAKALPKLLSHRHRTPTSQPLAHPSIRTALTTLILALLPLTLPLELFTALFKGIAQDEGVVVKLILEACWEKVWNDVKVPKSSKIKVFGGLGIYLQPLYDRTDPDATDPLAPADVVHHFLLALCTKPGTGICFRSRGWYPRPSENSFEDQGTTGKDEGATEEDGETSAKGTVYNPLLLKLLKILRPAVDARQHELAVRILNACPDLVGPYFAKGAAQLGLSLEPRLSTRWITSVGFVAAVVKAEIPVESFYLDTPAHALAGSSSALTRTYRADPPPLAAIVENVIPNVLTRAWLTKGLLTKPAPSGEQNPAPTSSRTLIQHTTIRLITQCLLKLSKVLESIPPGWGDRAAEVVDAVRKRVPELGVIVGITQEATKALEKSGGSAMDDETEARELLLAEGALRLMWLYARVLPGTMAETRFDVGKLLQETEIEELEKRQTSGMSGLRVMCQIHMLRLLGENDQFVWSAKPAGSQHTHMYRLLALHLRTPYPQLRAASAALITRLFGTNVLFEHDPKEVIAWIESLPRNKHASSPDAEDDITIFLAFFDDVLSRCVKTPYKYLEQGKQLYSSSNDISRMPSPLLMTVLEQLRHKPMEPSSRRLVASFLSRLIQLLVGKVEIQDAKAVSGYMRDVFANEGEASLGLKVVSRLEAFLEDLASAADRVDMETDVTLTHGAVQFVREMEALAAQVDDASKARATSRVVDWIRNSGEELSGTRATDLLRSLAPWVGEAVVREILEEIDLNVLSTSLLALMDDKEIFNPLLNGISFPTSFWMILRQSSDSTIQTVFLHSISQLPAELLTWACGLIAHRLNAAVNASSQIATRTCLVALSSLCHHAATTSEKETVKQALFAGIPIVKLLLMEPAWIIDLKSIVSTLLVGTNENDLALASPYSQHWSGTLLEGSSAAELEANATGFSVWIQFTPASTCIQILKSVLARIQNWSSISAAIILLLESLAIHLHSISLHKADSRLLAEALPAIIGIPKLIEFPSLLNLACTIVKHEIPLGLDQSLVERRGSLVEVVRQAATQWTSQTGVIGSISWSNFSGWVETEDLAMMSTALMYLSESARTAFAAWAEQQDNMIARSIGPCFALMDCYSAMSQNDEQQSSLSASLVDKILDCAARVLFKHNEPGQRQLWAMHTLIMTIQALPENIENVVQAVNKRYPSNHKDIFHRYALSFFVHGALQSHWEDTLDSVVDSGLLWLVRRFAEDDADSSDLQSCLPIFGRLLPRSSNIKPHLADPVLVAAIKNRLQSGCVMTLCSEIVAHTSLKPMNVNKLLQSILHHSSLTPICQMIPSLENGPIRLLRSLFYKHPSSTCHPSHIIPLVHIYRGTLSRQDTEILSIFRLFEKSRQISTSEIFKNWTPEPSRTQPKDFLEAVCNFEPAIMFRTCTSFPQRRDPQNMELRAEDKRTDIYDPNFVLSLLVALMSSDEPVTSMQWVDLCRTNVLSLAVSSLSSKRPAMRQLGYAALVTAYARLPDVDFQERNQLMYTLDLLRNLIPQPDSTPSHLIPRIPTYTTLLLSHALRDIFAPATPLYPLISRFLLQRPEFDPEDVPLLYTLLYSSSGEWRRERGWILRFLSDGMRSTEDWRVLKRRHTWDLLASLFQASFEDRMLRLSILEVLVNASMNKHAATSLVLSSSIISWIFMQIDHTLPGESLVYLKVLDNMAVVLDHEQVERATSGHWRDSIAEVVGKVIASRAEPDSSLVCLASRILLRLSANVNNTPKSFSQALSAIMDALPVLEASPVYAFTDQTEMDFNTEPLHTGRNLLQPLTGTPAKHWLSTIGALWTLCMNMEVDGSAWPRMTSRALLANVVQNGLGDFAWVRNQAVVSFISAPPHQ